MPILILLLLAGFASCAFGQVTAPARLQELGKVQFTEVEDRDIKDAGDISAIAYDERTGVLYIGSDEGAHIQLLEPVDGSRGGDGFFRQYRAEKKNWLDLLEGKWDKAEADEPEVDFEGMALQGDALYVIGSHSLKREKVRGPGDNKAKKYRKNRERLATVTTEKDRYSIFRYQLKSGTIATTSLRRQIERDSYLGRFAHIPSKENGVDIEGIAVAADTLFIGFRGPVLRGNYAPVMVTGWGSDESELRFVNLGGRGIRDMARVDGGFLIVAGPVGDLGSFQLYFWNGTDAIPGKDRDEGEAESAVRYLGEIPAPDGAKAEGITVLREGDGSCAVLVVYDGVTHGAPTLFRVAF